MATSRVTVECYAGHTYPTEPRAFTFRGTRHIVESVEHRWRTPGALWFRVRTAQGDVFTLAYDDEEFAWTVWPYAVPE